MPADTDLTPVYAYHIRLKDDYLTKQCSCNDDRIAAEALTGGVALPTHRANHIPQIPSP